MAQSTSVLDVVKANTPMPVRRVSRRMKQWIKDLRNRSTPPRDVFTEIYQKRLWGTDNEMKFYSGPGSDPVAAMPYCDFVKAFVDENKINSVVDLGCGDFRVGGLIAPSCQRYIGVDVVEPLIADNKQRHGSSSVTFECLDMTRDTLPQAELCLIREVLQHLSNAQIQAVLIRMRTYPYVLITDVQPADTSRLRINRDKIHGASSRIVHGSILRLDKPPFNVSGLEKVFEADTVFSADWAPYGTSFKLRTFLLRH